MVGLTLALVSAARGAQEPGGDIAPRIVCEEPTYHFGRRDESEVVERQFVIRNAGEAELRIGRVRTSCGCTVAAPGRTNIEPGGTTAIGARFTLADRTGMQRKHVYVESNDPATPRLTLTLEGEITRKVGLDPPYLSMGTLGKDEVAVRNARLVSDTPGVLITKVVCNTPRLKVDIWGEDKGRGAGLTVTSVPPLEPGFIRGTVLAYTTHPEKKAVRIVVSANVTGELNVLPQRIDLKPAYRGPVQLMVCPGTVKSFTVLRVVPPGDGIEAEIHEEGGGCVMITLRDLDATRALDGTFVRILTDVEPTAEIRVPIRVGAE
jgi:hypothetical protein